MQNKGRVLFYDIETTLLMCTLFAMGEQRVGHNQLVPGFSRWGIICITYCWNDGKPVKCIKWEPETGLKGIIEKFDAIIKTADFSIGKNSDRFDTKMINAARMFEGLPGIPEWVRYTDDLEKQMRKYFRLPSQSLDYISDQLGLGGKIKMQFGDWVDIQHWMHALELIKLGDGTYSHTSMIDIMCQQMYRKSLEEVLKDGDKAFTKMCTYGKKDTADTRTLWYKLSEHFDSRWNQAAFQGDRLACKHEDCGSLNLYKNGTRLSGKSLYQLYNCSDCQRYAGRCVISTKGKEGAIS